MDFSFMPSNLKSAKLTKLKLSSIFGIANLIEKSFNGIIKCNIISHLHFYRINMAYHPCKYEGYGVSLILHLRWN